MPSAEKPKPKQEGRLEQPKPAEKSLAEPAAKLEPSQPTEILATADTKPDPEQPKATTPAAKKTKRGGFSISSTLAGTKLDQKESKEVDEAELLAPQEGKPTEAFSQEQLNNFYNQYIEELRPQNKPMLLAALTGKNPLLTSASEAELTFENKTQEKFYNEGRLALLRFLRQKLNNYRLTIKTKVQAGSQTTEPYSPQEKFAYMANKNELLNELKQRLNLDIE